MLEFTLKDLLVSYSMDRRQIEDVSEHDNEGFQFCIVHYMHVW